MLDSSNQARTEVWEKKQARVESATDRIRTTVFGDALVCVHVLISAKSQEARLASASSSSKLWERTNQEE